MGKRQPPSRKRYQASHPSIGIHVDLPTHERLKKLRDKSGMSYGYLVRRALGVVEKEVERIMRRGFNKGRHAGHVEGKKAGFVEGHSAGYQKGLQEGRADGLAEGRREGSEEAERYKVEYRCARCGDAIAIERGDLAAAHAVAAVEAGKLAHMQCPPGARVLPGVVRSGTRFEFYPL